MLGYVRPSYGRLEQVMIRLAMSGKFMPS